MNFFPHLTESGSSLVQVLLVLGCGLVMTVFMDTTKRSHRSLVFGVAIVLAVRYIWWRGTHTLAPLELSFSWLASWSLYALELFTLISSMSAFLVLTRWRERTSEADANLGWWDDGRAPPRVVIMIATYNEELEVLERTIVGAQSLRWRNTKIMVLDDGRRDWLRDYCESRGVRHVTRPDNKHSKAGNINHALGLLAGEPNPPDFVAVLDADFVPHRGFISRCVALFHDPKVGLVQTPQHFFNADPLQHNLGLSRSYPDEQRFFFDHIEPSRDAWDIAVCCGTSSMIRWDALQEIGGFPTESVTEDFLLTLALSNKGWTTSYLNEALTEGLAPEGLKEYVTQRARWCLGQMQIARSSYGPFARNGLRLRDRWSVIDSVLYWFTTFPFRIATIVFPLFYWYFNIIVVDARLPDVITYFGCYYLWIMIALNRVSGNMMVPIVNDVSQLIGAIPITRAAIVGMLRPHGHPFSVTAKGGDRSKTVVQWRLAAPFIVLLVLTLVGLVLGIVSDRFAFHDAGDGKWVILFWTFYNVFVLSVTLIACVELPRREKHITDVPERATFVDGDITHQIWVSSLARDTARIRGVQMAPGVLGSLRLADVGNVPALVISQTEDGARLRLMPDDAQRDALYRRFYTDETAPGIATVRVNAILRDAARRLSFSSR